MKVEGLGGYPDIDSYVAGKLQKFSATEKRFCDLYPFMFSEKENVFAETNNGVRIKKITYGEAEAGVQKAAAALSRFAFRADKVGIYMQNCPEWIEVFWALLATGSTPVLLNTMMDDKTLSGIVSTYGICAVVTDRKDPDLGCETILKDALFAEDGVFDMSKENGLWKDSIFLLSSGTSGNIKLCEYRGENFFHQIEDSAQIIKECRQMQKHYEGYLKHLVFLPLYHIFGLSAVYMWFGFFSRTFVFLRDMSADTILYTVRKHKVTHIFCVPVLWNRIYEAAMKTVKSRGDETYSKFVRAQDFVNGRGTEKFLSRLIIKKGFAEVRENIFGESICFLISGGSQISPAVLKFFNGIGYHMANGYGTTETGITSVELSDDSRDRCTGSVGRPFASVDYELRDGVLWVNGPSRAARVFEKGEEIDFAEGGWYNTCDCMRCEDGRYFADGRQDDLIILEGGENLSPERIESALNIDGALDTCLVKIKDRAALIVRISPFPTKELMETVLESAKSELVRLNLRGSVKEIYLTSDNFMRDDEFKKNRKRIASDLENNLIKLITPDKIDEAEVQLDEELLARVRSVVALTLDCPEDTIKACSDFFTDLGGTSLDYFTLISNLQKEFGVGIDKNSAGISTVSGFCDYIRKNS